jgi:hypothetical protein
MVHELNFFAVNKWIFPIANSRLPHDQRFFWRLSPDVLLAATTLFSTSLAPYALGRSQLDGFHYKFPYHNFEGFLVNYHS